MADFAKHQAQFDQLDVRIVTVSSDPQEKAKETTDELGLKFPVLYGIDAEETSRLIGCYKGTHKGQPHIQPASFVLDAEGRVVHAVYSSGKVGRLTAEDALTIAQDVRKKVSQPG